MKKLSDLPNIGKELEKRLIKAGIENEEELKLLGSEKAFIRLKAFDITACINQLLALEGAIQGIRWHNLSKQRKQELNEYLKLLE